ncbi:MAG: leucyl aminopeptidase family protein [Planctomycetota bacterium]
MNRILFDIVPAESVDRQVVVAPITESGWSNLVSSGELALVANEARVFAELSAGSRFAAKPGEHLVGRVGGLVVHLVGLGSKFSTRSFREAAAHAVGVVPPATPWNLVVPKGEPEAGATRRDLLAAAVQGLGLGAYRFKRSASPAPAAPGPCGVVGGVDAATIQDALQRVEGQLLTRDLVNTPADRLGPADLVEAAREVGERHGMRVRTLFDDEVDREGFKLVASTGRAAERRPAVAIVEMGDPNRAPDLALVGKGVVFDTGGLDIKTGGYMKLMRKDMGGAGTIIGALDALGRLGFDGSLLAVLPAAENAIGPRAMRPGDVLDSMDGQTVEIGNTDAEGRLLLADGLCYARKRGAKRILDVATLTGAARVALGPDVPALFGNDEELVQLLLDTSKAQDEPVWRMPLVDDYEWTIDSPFADVNNSGSDNRGGAITAALFLRRFARDTPWAHVDLYAWEDRGRPGTPRGANGMFVRTLTRAVESLLAR